MWAAWMLGAVWVPTNFRLTPPEVAYLAESSGAAAHIFDAAFPEHAAAARAANPAMRLEVALGRRSTGLTWEALTAAEPRARAPPMSGATIRRGSSTPPAPPAGRRRRC